MAAILVDYENVSASDGLKGVEYLNENDTLIVFYSQCCEKIRAEYIDMIEKSQCEFKVYKLVHTGKNALDFYIAVECGFLGAHGENQISIISKDKGFSAVTDFLRLKSETEEITVHTAPNIESALLSSNTLQDAERKKEIKEKTKSLNIGAEQARIKEHRAFAEKIKKVFEGTEYEKNTADILRFIEKYDVKSLKLLYTGSLRAFGREDGRGIYQMLKSVV
ncbi:MAG: hypothetical protein IKC46_06225 [Lachnospiraceae bacterium]|nr:hypothetical protein [Lachnospiraceae bacterium]